MLMLLLMLLLGWGERDPPILYIQLPIDRLCGCYVTNANINNITAARAVDRELLYIEWENFFPPTATTAATATATTTNNNNNKQEQQQMMMMMMMRMNSFSSLDSTIQH